MSRPPGVADTSGILGVKKASKRKPKQPRGRKPAPGAAAPHRSAAPRPSKPARSASTAARSGSGQLRSAVSAALVAYGPDDRQALALLMLPFLVMALAIGTGQSLRPAARLAEVARESRPASPPPATADRGDVRARPSESAAERARPDTAAAQPPIVLATPRLVLPQAAPVILESTAVLAGRPPVLATAVPAELSSPGPMPTAPALRLDPTSPIVARTTLALAARAIRLPPGPPGMPSPIEPPTGSRAVGLTTSPPAVCVAPAKTAPTPGQQDAPRDSAAFGVALASAAKEQTREFVVYNDKYRRIAYPMGDVSPFYGVCTDVIIRAYRRLGIDLQALVHTSRVGSGDANIDHRRVDTLRRFFAAHGVALPVTDFAEDYRPGDIVSYWRPQNRHSRTHIAIVANEIGPSGRPMIIHNRGWGPQIEDGLFVDQITGHYRFSGPRTQPAGAVRGASASDPPATRSATKAHVEAGPRSSASQRRRQAVVAGESTSR